MPVFISWGYAQRSNKKCKRLGWQFSYLIKIYYEYQSKVLTARLYHYLESKNCHLTQSVNTWPPHFICQFCIRVNHFQNPIIRIINLEHLSQSIMTVISYIFNTSSYTLFAQYLSMKIVLSFRIFVTVFIHLKCYNNKMYYTIQNYLFCK